MASKSKRNKVKFKWTKELGFLLGALAVVIGVTIALAIPSKAERNLSKINEAITTYNTDNSTSYYTIDKKDNHLKVIDHKQLVAQKDKKGYTFVWYGSLTSGTYLESLYTLNYMAEDYDIDTIYLYYPTYIEEATEDGENNTEDYHNTLLAMEKELFSGDSVDKKIELEEYPALFVFKDGGLVFNSQIAEDTSEYTWTNFFSKAFGLVESN